MKLCVIGGGSTYTPELVDGLLRRRDVLPITELHLVDIDEARLAVLGPLAQRMVQHAGSDLVVRYGTDRAAGIEGSAFVVSQIRVGGMAARQRDEELGKEFGRFDERMKKLADHIRQAHEDAQDVHTTSQKISKRFDSIERVDLDHLTVLPLKPSELE